MPKLIPNVSTHEPVETNGFTVAFGDVGGENYTLQVARGLQRLHLVVKNTTGQTVTVQILHAGTDNIIATADVAAGETHRFVPSAVAQPGGSTGVTYVGELAHLSYLFDVDVATSAVTAPLSGDLTFDIQFS